MIKRTRPTAAHPAISRPKQQPSDLTNKPRPIFLFSRLPTFVSIPSKQFPHDIFPRIAGIFG